MPIVAVVSDLIFDAKVAGMARATGINVQVVRTTAAALERLDSADGLIVDLHLDPPAGDPLALIRAARASRPELRIVAFVSHVQFEHAEAGRRAGADEVLPRSRFSKQLADVLRRLASPSPSP
jgi:CheY-like chemotaxis protein